eukprot:TRINITY_DN124055_c0_g1_i1.p2 TRINITY_DN124055_c0_g1~~TRINITY_DN124055_c0_g1_i1.p2  ORF type:complete len:107 (+),score=27.17 TRINITY_DN124055_c0_g1_i1:110-430(+)
MGIFELWEMLRNGSIDFVGQKKSYDLQFYVIWVAGLIGFMHGYAVASFLITFYWVFGATCIVTLVCLPSWPWWNRNPEPWLEPKPDEEDDSKDTKDKKSKGSKKDK